MKKIIKWTSVILALAALSVTVMALIPGKNAVKTVASDLVKDVFASAPASESAIPGDVDGNGSVNIRDAARLLLYLSDRDVDCLNAALDADGNGTVDNNDAAAILKSITGWDVTLAYGDACEHVLTSHEHAASSCTESGKIAYFSCDKCGKLFKDEECVFAVTSAYTVIEPNGHVEAIDEAVAPTCGTCGYTEGSHCAVCGVTLRSQEEIEATGEHDFSAIGNEWIGTANYVQSVCAVCSAPSGVQFEGSFSEESNTLMLRGCSTDFTFDIVCSENESFIRENLIIVESMFSTLEGELLDAFANEYELESLGGDVWRVSPAKPYDERMSYEVLLGWGIEIAHFPGRDLSFRTAGEASDVEVYRNDILFLRDIENRDPGYYPYTIFFDNDAMQYTLTVSKPVAYSDALIGRVLCVGECTDMETASKMSSDEVDIGKITAIENYEDGAIITLGPVDFTDIYAELDVTLGDKEMTVTETLTEEERMLFAASILTNESFLAEMNTAQMAAEDYAAVYGAKSVGVDWIKVFYRLIDELDFKCVPSEDNLTSTVSLTLENFRIPIPLEIKDGEPIGSVVIILNLEIINEIKINGKVSHTNIADYLAEKINIFEEDTLVAEFYAELETKTKTSLGIDITIESAITKTENLYLVNPNTGTVHHAYCHHPRKHADDPENYYTINDLWKKYKDAAGIKSHECQTCKPFTEYSHFIINSATNTVHLNICQHIPTINDENRYYSSIIPKEGAVFGKSTLKYCLDCRPGYLPPRSFDEYMEESLKSADWETYLNSLKNKIFEDTNLTQVPVETYSHRINLWVLDIGVDLKPIFSFEPEACLDFDFVTVTKHKHVFELVHTTEGYGIFINSNPMALTQQEKEEITFSADMTGKIEAKIGAGLKVSLGPVFISDFFNINLYAETGLYADLRGIIHLDFNKLEHSYASGYAELGAYVFAEVNFNIITVALRDPITVLEEQHPIRYVIGDDMIYYGFTDYEQVIDLGNKTDYRLKDSLLTAYCYNLKEMCTETVDLSFFADRGHGYTVNTKVTDAKGKVLAYCKAADGILYVSSDAPEKFEAYLHITVADTDTKFEWRDEPGEKYTLPELTVKIIYDSSREPDDPGFELGYSTGLAYKLNSTGDGYTVTGIGKCTDTEIVIPQKYMGLPVTAVGYGAFKNNKNITYLALPDGLTHVGSYAFYGCTSLSRIEYPASIEYIGDFAGYGCTSITEIYISENISHIGVGAFSGCESLSYISVAYNNPHYFVSGRCLIEKETKILIVGCAYSTIPTDGSVTKIGDYAFDGVIGLESIKIPLAITEIGNCAFRNCYSLTALTYEGTEDAWKNIVKGTDWNKGCPEITITFEGKTTDLAYALSEDGKSYIVTGIGGYPFLDVIIPSTYKGLPVTGIDDYAFQKRLFYDKNITSVIIPEGIKTIGRFAFYNCTLIKTLELPDSLISIGASAFYSCKGLTEVKFGKGLEIIESNAFSSCSSLTSLELPSSLKEICSRAFISCEKLSTVSFAGTVEEWNKIYRGTEINYESPFTFVICTNGKGTLKNQAPSKGLSFILNQDQKSYSVSGIGQNREYEIIIPQEYNGLPVTAVADDAFSDAYHLTSIQLPESILIIGENAFCGCTELTSINIPTKVTSIGASAFADCVNLTEINLPTSITHIGSKSFFNCWLLEKISFLGTVYQWNKIYKGPDWCDYYYMPIHCTDGEGLTRNQLPSEGLAYVLNEDEASYTVTGIGSCKDKDINIPAEYNGLPVTVIGERAFAGIDYVTSYYIPSSIKQIKYDAFLLKSSDLKAVHIDDLYAWCQMRIGAGDANPLNAGCDLYLNNVLVTDLVIPEGITELNSTFEGCSSITSVSLPESLTRISGTFRWCYNLTSVNISANVEWIGDSTFADCGSLDNIVVDADNKYFYCVNGCLIKKGAGKLLRGSNNSIIPTDGSVTSIGDFAFSGCWGLTEIVIPDCITSIGGSAFYDCSSLISINLPEGITTIENLTFVGCYNLTNINIPNSVTSIGSSAFWHCANLQNINIPNNVTSIGDSAFYSCESLQSINIPSSVTSIGEEAFWNCTSLAIIELSNGITAIEEDMFNGCISLTSITIPNSVTSIGRWAFLNCIRLESISIPNSVTSIQWGAFDGCTNLRSITLSNGVTSIGQQAFADCIGLESISIPNSVTNIGESAFYGCANLKSIVISDSVTNIGEKAFYGCANLESITVGSKNKIYHSSGNCLIDTELKTILRGCKNSIIPNDGSVYRIGYGAFSDCCTLANITIPGSITCIDGQAFSDCEELTSITIHNDITSIGEYTFFGCTSLASVTFTGTQSEWYVIEKGDNWNYDAPFTVIHCTDGDVNVN